MIFPTGSRYSADMKGGAILIAKLAKAPIVPAVYQGPGSFWSLFKRKPAIVRFGAPVEPPKDKLTDEALAAFSDKLQENFNALDYAGSIQSTSMCLTRRNIWKKRNTEKFKVR